MDRRFRTSLDDFALDILNLVAARLREEDETKLAKLMLVFDIDLDDLQKLSAEEFDARSRETLKRLDGTFPIFGGKLSA
jgi:hypothetical protein